MKLSNTRKTRQEQQGTEGFDSAEVLSIIGSGGTLTYYSTLDSLPNSGDDGDKAFVEDNTRLYIRDGDGWYNTSLVNLSPRWDSIPLGLLDSTSIVDSATDLVIVAKALDSDNSNLNLINQSFASDSAQYLVNISNDSSVWTFDPKSDDSISASVTAGDLDDSDENSFIYTFKWSDGINFVSKAITINYNFSRALTLPLLVSSNVYRIGTTNLSYNSSTKKIGTHSAYITGGGSLNRRPGYSVGSATSEVMTSYTISMWINVAQYNSSYNLMYPWNMDNKTSAGNSYGSCAMMLQTNGRVEFCTDNYDGSNYSGITLDVGNLTTGTWYHIVAGATQPLSGTHTASLYMSQNSFGDLANTTGLSNNSGQLFTGTSVDPLYIGNLSSGAWYLHGSIGNAADAGCNAYYDDVRIYQGEATAAQAEAIYNSNGDPTLNNGQSNSLKYMYTFDNTNYSYSV